MLQMMNDKILVKKTKAPERSKDGLLYTQEQGIKSSEGYVISVNRKSQFLEGDYILFGEYNGSEIIHDNEKLLILCEEDVFAIDQSKSKNGEEE